jgi:hypothetical protein
MTYELTNEEKETVVNQHIRSLEYSKYNVQVSIKVENAAATPNTVTVADLNTQLTDLNAKLVVLAAELALITG